MILVEGVRSLIFLLREAFYWIRDKFASGKEMQQRDTTTHPRTSDIPEEGGDDQSLL